MQFEFICKIKPVLFVNVTVCSEFQCINTREFLQTDWIGSVPKSSLFCAACMGFWPLCWLGIFKYSYVKLMFCSSSYILCCSVFWFVLVLGGCFVFIFGGFFVWGFFWGGLIFNTKF